MLVEIPGPDGVTSKGFIEANMTDPVKIFFQIYTGEEYKVLYWATLPAMVLPARRESVRFPLMDKQHEFVIRDVRFDFKDGLLECLVYTVEA